MVGMLSPRRATAGSQGESCVLSDGQSTERMEGQRIGGSMNGREEAKTRPARPGRLHIQERAGEQVLFGRSRSLNPPSPGGRGERVPTRMPGNGASTRARRACTRSTWRPRGHAGLRRKRQPSRWRPRGPAAAAGASAGARHPAGATGHGRG